MAAPDAAAAAAWDDEAVSASPVSLGEADRIATSLRQLANKLRNEQPRRFVLDSIQCAARTKYGRNMLVRVILLGSSLPEGCPHREGLFELELLLDCGERGPLRCLNVRFATDVIHPNFTRDMGICHCHADFLPALRRKSHLLWNILDDLHRRMHSPIVPLPHQIAVIQPRKQLSDVEVVKMRKEREKKEQTKTALALAIEKSKMPTSSIQSLASIIKAQRTSKTWATKAKSMASLAGSVEQLHVDDEEGAEAPGDNRLAMPCGSRLDLAAEFSYDVVQQRAARLCATELARRPQLLVRAADMALERALFSDDPRAWQALTLKSLLALDRVWHTQEQAWTSQEGGSTESEPTVLEIHENVETLPPVHRLTVAPFLSACDVRVERATDLIHPDDDAGLRRLETSYESAHGLSDRPATIDLFLNRKADGSAELVISPVRRRSSDAHSQPPRVLAWAKHDMDGYIVVVFSRTDLSIVSHKLFSRSHPWGMKKMLQHLLTLDSSHLVVMYSPAWREMTTSNLTWLGMAKEQGSIQDDAIKAFFHCGAYHWLTANHPSTVKKNANMQQLEHLTHDKRLEEQRKALIVAQNRGWGSPPVKLPEKQMASLAAKLAEAQQVEHLLVTYDRVPAEPTRPEGVPVTSSYCFVGVPGEPRNVKHTMELYMHKPNEYGARPVALLLVLDPSQESYTLIQPNVPLENCDTTELLKRLYPRDKFGRETELVGIKAQFQYYQPALQKIYRYYAVSVSAAGLSHPSTISLSQWRQFCRDCRFVSDEVPLDVCVSVFKEILLTAKTVAVKIKLFVSHHDFIYGEFLLAILRMGMLIYHQAPARSLSLLMRLMVIPRAKCFEDDVLFEEVYFKEESQLLLFPHKDPLHRYFCAYRDPRLKTITNKSWNEFLKATRLCSTITGLSTIRSYANFSRSLKRGSVQASDLDPEQFYEAIARCALDIFGVGHNGFKSAMIVSRVLSWYKRAKAKLKRDQTAHGGRRLLRAMSFCNPQAEADLKSQVQSQVLTTRITPHEFNNCMCKMLRLLQDGPPTLSEMFEWRAEARLKEGETCASINVCFTDVAVLATISQATQGEEE